MTTKARRIELEDAPYHFAMEFEPRHAAKLLAKYVARYPEIAEELTEVAAALLEPEEIDMGREWFRSRPDI